MIGICMEDADASKLKSVFVAKFIPAEVWTA